MKNVKNNHDAPLNVGGVVIRAGGVAGVSPEALKVAMGSNGVKQWLKLGIIEIEDDADEAEAKKTAKAEKAAAAKAEKAVAPVIPSLPQ